MLLLLQLAPGPLPVAAAAAPDIRENLEYQISLGPWSDVARVHLVLKELKPGHYLAEFSGAAQGMWQLLSRWLPERYQTEMVYREGRLRTRWSTGKNLSERANKSGRSTASTMSVASLTLWRQVDGGEKIKKWEVPLKGPVYDLLSLFYNVRLGALGPAARRRHPAGNGPAGPQTPGDGLSHRRRHRPGAAR